MADGPATQLCRLGAGLVTTAPSAAAAAAPPSAAAGRWEQAAP